MFGGERDYKVRADYLSQQHWSDVISIIPHEENNIDLQLELLADLTHDPRPDRFDGVAPVYEPEKIMVASLSSIRGLLVQSVVGQTPEEKKIYYFINDHLGTPQKLLDESADVVWSADYKPFGEVDVNPNSEVANNFRFPGQYYDQESGLNYNYHRYYDPSIGRYLKADPIGLVGGINLYAYAGLNPINTIDPLGLLSEVLTFQPRGWGSSSFGHSAININGVVYSWGPNGMWVGTFKDYMKKNEFRDAVGAVLKISSEEEKRLENFIKNFGKKNQYTELTDNCGDPIESGIEDLRYDLGINVFPVSLGEAIDKAGLVDRYNIYLRSPSQPTPKWWESAPWAK